MPASSCCLRYLQSCTGRLQILCCLLQELHLCNSNLELKSKSRMFMTMHVGAMGSCDYSEAAQRLVSTQRDCQAACSSNMHQGKLYYLLHYFLLLCSL